MHVHKVESNVIADNNWRYVIMQGILCIPPAVLTWLYNPNWEKDGFCKE